MEYGKDPICLPRRRCREARAGRPEQPTALPQAGKVTHTGDGTVEVGNEQFRPSCQMFTFASSIVGHNRKLFRIN